MSNNNYIDTSYGLSQPLIKNAQPPIISKRNPTTADRAQLGTEWVNTSANTAFTLTSIVDNVATWEAITNLGGSPTFVADTGSATPVADTLRVTGSGITTTSGTGNTLTINTPVTSYVTSSGTATPSANVINFIAGSGITTTGAGSTVTIAATGEVTSVVGGNNITITGTASVPIVNVSGTTNHAVQIGNATNSLTSVAVGATNTVLLGNTGADPSFGTVPNAALTNSSVTLSNGQNITVTGSPLSLGGTATIALSGTVPIANGGTNASSMATTDGVVYFDGTRLVTTAVGAATQVLTSNGVGVAPTFQAASGGSGIVTINGNVGSVTGATVTLDTQVPLNPVQGTAHFEGSGTHMWLNFSDDSGGNNICIGRAAYDGSTGGHNISLGEGTLGNISGGGYNVALGDASGDAYTGTEGSNVLLNSLGVVGDNHTLRIGAATGTSQQELQAAYICGIDGVNVGSVAKVVTMASDQLGTATITAGTGISVTPTANIITIAVTGGSGITSIAGNLGGAQTGPAITLVGSVARDYGTINVQNPTSNTLKIVPQDAFHNVGLGLSALSGPSVSGTFNCAYGESSGTAITSGGNNCFYGSSSGHAITTGQYSIMIGTQSGINDVTGTESNNVYLNSPGVNNESNALRIGSGTGTSNQNLNQAFVSGIQGITVTGAAVLVSTSDQLGVAASSKRFKSDIQDMGSASSALYKLRPVSFVWNKDSSLGLKDATDMRQYGLIAEEAVEHVPHVVNLDKDGKPFNINYQDLIGMLINEIQQLNKRIASLEKK